MNDPEFIAKLRDRAASYRQGGPSAEHTASLLEEAADRLMTTNRLITNSADADAGLESALLEIEQLKEELSNLTVDYNAMIASHEAPRE